MQGSGLLLDSSDLDCAVLSIIGWPACAQVPAMRLACLPPDDKEAPQEEPAEAGGKRLSADGGIAM